MPDATCPDPARGAAATIVGRWSFGPGDGQAGHVSTGRDRGHWVTPAAESPGPQPAANARPALVSVP